MTQPYGTIVKWCWLGQQGSGMARRISTQAALRGAIAKLSRLRRPWCCATDAAATFVLTLLRLGWSAQSARHLTTHDGTKIDLLAVAPKTVGFWVDQASLVWTDSSAHWGSTKTPRCSPLVAWMAGRAGITMCWSSWCRAAYGRRKGSRGSGAKTRIAASSAMKPQAPCSTAVTNVRHLAWTGTCVSRRKFGRRPYLWQRNTGNSLHMAFSPLQLPSCLGFFLNVLAQSFGTTAQQTGSSWRRTSSPTARLRAAACCGVRGWAVVAVDDLGNLKATVYGTVPSDVLPNQSSRDGEDNAAAMAGLFTLDPLTLHIGCEGTVATIQGSVGGNSPPSARLEQAVGFPRSGQGSHNARRGKTIPPTFQPRKERMHTSHLSTSPRLWSLALRWPWRGGQPRPTSCSE